jgi:hypothetical protein
MSPEYIAISICIALVGVVVSVVTATFAAGSKWGTMNATMTTISERLARIEGMFELKLKDK